MAGDVGFARRLRSFSVQAPSGARERACPPEESGHTPTVAARSLPCSRYGRKGRDAALRIAGRAFHVKQFALRILDGKPKPLVFHVKQILGLAAYFRYPAQRRLPASDHGLMRSSCPAAVSLVPSHRAISETLAEKGGHQGTLSANFHPDSRARHSARCVSRETAQKRTPGRAQAPRTCRRGRCSGGYCNSLVSRETGG